MFGLECGFLVFFVSAIAKITFVTLLGLQMYLVTDLKLLSLDIQQVESSYKNHRFLFTIINTEL